MAGTAPGDLVSPGWGGDKVLGRRKSDGTFQYILTDPAENTIVDTIVLGGIITGFSQISKIRRMSIDLTGATSGFLDFGFQVPTGMVLLVGHMLYIANKKNSLRVGYADDAIGTNFVQLFSEGILTPAQSNSGDSDFIFIIPADKFPIVEIVSTISDDGFILLEGVEELTAAVSSQFGVTIQ